MKVTRKNGKKNFYTKFKLMYKFNTSASFNRQAVGGEPAAFSKKVRPSKVYRDKS